jgi:hypothetical protein
MTYCKKWRIITLTPQDYNKLLYIYDLYLCIQNPKGAIDTRFLIHLHIISHVLFVLVYILSKVLDNTYQLPLHTYILTNNA